MELAIAGLVGVAALLLVALRRAPPVVAEPRPASAPGPRPMPPVAATRRVLYLGVALAGRTTSLEHAGAGGRRGPLEVRREHDLEALARTVAPRGAGLALELLLVGQADASAAERRRRAALRACDAVVLVVDSRPERLDEQRALVAEVDEELAARGLDPRTFPLAIQWNKRDLEGALPVEALAAALNPWGAPAVETVAITGQGVDEALAAVLRRLDGPAGPRETRAP